MYESLKTIRIYTLVVNFAHTLVISYSLRFSQTCSSRRLVVRSVHCTLKRSPINKSQLFMGLEPKLQIKTLWEMVSDINLLYHLYNIFIMHICLDKSQYRVLWCISVFSPAIYQVFHYIITQQEQGEDMIIKYHRGLLQVCVFICISPDIILNWQLIWENK